MLYVGFVAKVRLMYWKEIPVQVKAEDETGQISVPLDARFQEGADATSIFDGSSGSDAYLAAFQWGDYFEEPGSAQEAGIRVAERINNRFPKDFVSRVRELERVGKRNPRPGAVDDWMEE